MSDENLDDIIAQLVDDDVADEPEDQQTSENEQKLEAMGVQKKDSLSGDETVHLTERAARQVEKIRSDEKLSDNLYLRVAVEGGGCAGLSYKLGFDEETENDLHLNLENVDVVVDKRHMLYLDGVTIDYPDGLDARGFTFSNPNASDTCGCGSSFAT